MQLDLKNVIFVKYQKKFFIVVNTIISKNGYFYAGNVLTKLNQTIRILINMVELGKAKKLKCNDCSEYFEEVKAK